MLHLYFALVTGPKMVKKKIKFGAVPTLMMPSKSHDVEKTSRPPPKSVSRKRYVTN